MEYFRTTILFAAAFFIMKAHANEAKTLILDVRTPQEYQESHIKDSSNIDVLAPDFKDKISKLDKAKPYKLYCRSGSRSGKAAEIMKAQGFKNLENLGSLHEASVKLNQKCDGQGPC